MGLTWAPYYQLARVNSAGPETKNYAVTDTNWLTSSLLFKKFEGHHHNAATPMRYPGFNLLNTATPATPLLTLTSTGGSIAAGVSLGIRLSLVDQFGLETEASPETFIQTPAVTIRPNAPIVGLAVATPVPGGLPGGTYVYAITKRLNTGESMLSDVSTVDVPFNANATTSYVVPMTFDPISLYTDGTDSLCLYRTTGFDTNFVLLSSFTATPGLQNNLTTYTDNGTVQDPTQQPPQVSEFGKQNLLNINWSTISIPATAYRFRIYLTQQSGVWGTQNLFQDYLLVNPTTPVPNNVSYQGTETLGIGYPFDYTQIPIGAPLINLTTEAIGAPIYTTTANAMGYQTINFMFPVGVGNATPLFGAAYVDTNGQFKIALSTPSGANNPAIFTTLAGVGSGYAHPVNESGGHAASRIQAAPNVGGPTQDLLNNLFSTPVAGGSTKYRIPATSIYKVTATPATLQNSTVGKWQTIVGDLDTNLQFSPGIQPDFPGQWFEIDFRGLCLLNWGSATPQFGSFMLMINGQPIPETWTSGGIGINNSSNSMYINPAMTYATPFTVSNNRVQVQWQLSYPGSIQLLGSNIAGGPVYHSLIIKELF